MKIQASIRAIYDLQRERNEILKEKVDKLAAKIRNPNWFYISRIKELESFALKVESGRFSKPDKMEDFFGCLFVVPNLTDIQTVENLILTNFELVERRPKDQFNTNKEPENFRFDDVRLYVKWKDDPALPPTDITDITFEIQLKTFLMHAWAIATHDLIYKSSNPSWATARIAFQVRAMLEHAEISIFEAENLAKSPTLNLTTTRIGHLIEIGEFLVNTWDREELPSDLTHISENVDFLMQIFGLSTVELGEILKLETKSGRGVKTSNLSPYSVIIRSVYNQRPDIMERALSTDPERFRYPYKGKRILITPEINVNLSVHNKAIVIK